MLSAAHPEKRDPARFASIEGARVSKGRRTPGVR
jgi:hypothetical protein